MSYEKAKEKFEAVVTRMQAELKEYADKPGASQKAIDARLENINALVDYYQAAEALVSELDWQLLDTQMALSQFRTVLQKLVYWCDLHRVKVNAIFHYEENELKSLCEKRINFAQEFAIENEEIEQIVSKYQEVGSFFRSKTHQEQQRSLQPSQHTFHKQLC